MEKHIEVLVGKLQIESEKINNESEFDIGDNIKIINHYDKSYINQIGEITSRKDFDGRRVIKLISGEMKQIQEGYMIKL